MSAYYIILKVIPHHMVQIIVEVRSSMLMYESINHRRQGIPNHCNSLDIVERNAPWICYYLDGSRYPSNIAKLLVV